MDGFTGFKTATAEELPDAVAVMDPFHVVRLAGDALDRCRRRVQQAIHGHRGMKNDPLHSARRTLHTGADLLTDTQTDRLAALFADDAQVEVEATLGDLPADDRGLPRAGPGSWLMNRPWLGRIRGRRGGQCSTGHRCRRRRPCRWVSWVARHGPRRMAGGVAGWWRAWSGSR